MAIKLTATGQCPECGERIVKIDQVNPQRMFYRVKSMMIDRVTGEVICQCTKCKAELLMPVVKIPKKIKRGNNVPSQAASPA